MASRTPVAEKPATDEETPAAEEETPKPPESEEGLSSQIKAYVEEAVEKAVAGFKELTGGKGGNRTRRDEEDEMNDLVGSKVKELLDKERATAEKHPEPGTETVKPEPVPAQPEPRRIEKLFGWS